MRPWPILALGLGVLGQEPPAKLQDLLGIPYRVDGAEDARGRFVTFSAPTVVQASPGLNCSGLVLAASRRLLGYSGDPRQAARDRLGDSGPSAPRGADWDFGWDLVLNLSEGLERRWITPTGAEPVGEDAATHRGFGMHEPGAWEALLPRLQEGRVYLGVLNRRRRGHLQHHHVAVLLREGRRVGFYQALPQGRTHRMELTAPAGLARLRTMFGPGEHLRILEVTPTRP